MVMLLIKKQIMGLSGKGMRNWWYLVTKKRSSPTCPGKTMRKIWRDEAKLKFTVMAELLAVNELRPDKYNLFLWEDSGHDNPPYKMLEINKSDISRFYEYRIKRKRGLRMDATF